MHVLNEFSPPSIVDPVWVPHTATLCGREFHLQSDFLVTHKSKMYIIAEEIVCKICLKKYKRTIK